MKDKIWLSLLIKITQSLSDTLFSTIKRILQFSPMLFIDIESNSIDRQRWGFYISQRKEHYNNCEWLVVQGE